MQSTEEAVEKANALLVDQDESVKRMKYQKDPTSDLIEVFKDRCPKFTKAGAYYVFCEDTEQAWYCPTQDCLDSNFVYRDDLTIYKLDSKDDLQAAYGETIEKVNRNYITKKTCFILNNPAAMTYEVYYEPTYPAVKYGKQTPSGMCTLRYKNRFHRDLDIMRLDELYASMSCKKAGDTKKQLDDDEAIIISEGCCIADLCAEVFYYIDKTSVVKITEGCACVGEEQLKILGAINVLSFCQLRGKKKITYVCNSNDVTLNVFKNNEAERSNEVKAYKKLCNEMVEKEYTIKFAELQLEDNEDADEQDRAFKLFKGYCEKECQDMVNIFVDMRESIADIIELVSEEKQEVSEMASKTGLIV